MKVINNIKKRIARIATFAAAVVGVSVFPAYAGDLESSPVVTGTRALINDVTTILIALSLVLGACAATYFIVRKSMADEADGKTWQKRAVTAIVCGVLGALMSGIVKVISGYYGL